MTEGDIEVQLLLALREVAPSLSKCDRILRLALQSLGQYDADSSETALCGDGDEDPAVALLYRRLREMILLDLAEGAGDWRLPAGPRYTECRITRLGEQRLEERLGGGGGFTFPRGLQTAILAQLRPGERVWQVRSQDSQWSICVIEETVAWDAMRAKELTGLDMGKGRSLTFECQDDGWVLCAEGHWIS
jgi:hypothetical protein